MEKGWWLARECVSMMLFRVGIFFVVVTLRHGDRFDWLTGFELNISKVTLNPSKLEINNKVTWTWIPLIGDINTGLDNEGEHEERFKNFSWMEIVSLQVCWRAVKSSVVWFKFLQFHSKVRMFKIYYDQERSESDEKEGERGRNEMMMMVIRTLVWWLLSNNNTTRGSCNFKNWIWWWRNQCSSLSLSLSSLTVGTPLTR